MRASFLGVRGRARRMPYLQRLASWLVALCLPLGCGLASVAIGQDIDGDTLTYHYYDAWAFLHGRSLTDIFPANFQTLLNPLEDVPIFFLDTHLPPTYAAFLLGCWQGLGPLLVFLIARRMTTNWWIAVIAGVTAAVSGGFDSELGAMMGDSTVAPFYLLGVLLFVVAARSTESDVGVRHDGERSKGRVRLSDYLIAGAGVAIGAGIGLKYAEASLGAAAVVAVPLLVNTWRARLRALMLAGVGTIVGLGATAGYWTWFLVRYYKDPFAFTGDKLWIFSSPFGGSNASQPWRGPATFLQGLWFPIYWFFHPTAIIGIDLRAASLPLAYIACVLLALCAVVHLVMRARRLPSGRGDVTYVPSAVERSVEPAVELVRVRIDRYLIATFLLTLLAWIKIFGVYRYLLPLEALSPVVLLAAARRAVHLLEQAFPLAVLDRRAALGGFALAGCLCIGTSSGGNFWLRIPFGVKEFSVTTPAMLHNGHLDAIVEEGADWEVPNSNPDSFVLPELDARFVAIGATGMGPTSEQARLDRLAFARVRRAGGSVVGMWISVPPPGSQIAYLALLGDPGMRVASCVKETLYVGAGYEPIGFCRYVPISLSTRAAE